MINISQKIKNVCKQNTLFPAFFAIITAVILILCPFINIFHPTNLNTIYNVKNSDSYVNVTADTLYYTGYNLTKNIGTDYGYYYALKDGSCIFTLIPINAKPETVLHNYTFKAKVLAPDKNYSKMIASFAKDLNWNEKGLKSTTADFVLSNADYNPTFYMVMLWCVLIVLFVSLKKLVGTVAGYINPAMYPVCTFLGKDVQKKLIDEAQAELDSEKYLQINSMYITENYFIDLETSKVSIIPLNEIIWCYRLGTISLNPKRFDPEYSIHFTLLNGSVITAKHKTSDEALELINAIRATEYDIVIGHSESKKKQVKKIISRYAKENNNV